MEEFGHSVLAPALVFALQSPGLRRVSAAFLEMQRPEKQEKTVSEGRKEMKLE